jgi:hypothetical protein
MEQKFAAAGAEAIAGGKSFADADDYATSRANSPNARDRARSPLR